MKLHHFAVLGSLLLGSGLNAQELPDAPIAMISSSLVLSPAQRPKPQPRFFQSKANLALATGVIASRFGDWSTTMEMDRLKYTGYREGNLPHALTDSKLAFGLYSGGMAAGAIYGQYLVAKHGHPRIAQFAQLINISFTAYTVAQNESHARGWVGYYQDLQKMCSVPNTYTACHTR
jgi:hypothetical protein